MRNVIEVFGECSSGTRGKLIGTHELGDRKPRARALFQKLGARREGEGSRSTHSRRFLRRGQRSDLGMLAIVIRLRHDEAAAHRIIGALQQQFTRMLDYFGRRRPTLAIRGDAVLASRNARRWQILTVSTDCQSIDVIGQDPPRKETNIGLDIKGNLTPTRKRKHPARGDRRDDALDRIDRNSFWVIARQTQQDRAIRVVASSGRTKRTKKLDAHVGEPRILGKRTQLRRKSQARTHGAHRV